VPVRFLLRTPVRGLLCTPVSCSGKAAKKHLSAAQKPALSRDPIALDMLLFAGAPGASMPARHAEGRQLQRTGRQRSTRTGALPRSRARWRACQPAFQLDTEEFLRKDWGRKPVVLRALLPHFTSPLSPDELAGLACIPEVESRIISGSGPAPGNPRPHYGLRVGPFTGDTFQKELSDDDPWTLLVQELNRWDPRVADILDDFAFLPNWRVDDVMVSYATAGGGVGPHVDNYDVFLVQGAGARRWRFGHSAISHDEERLVPDLDVRILDGGFKVDEECTLYPGDCLYVPPRFPHWGESLDNECITYSIGFRAPTIADLTVGWAEAVTEAGYLQNNFLADKTRDLISNMQTPGRITDTAVDVAFGAVLNALRDSPAKRAQFADWLCEEISAPKRFREALDPEEEPQLPDAELDEMVETLIGSDPPDNIQVRQREGSVYVYRERDSGEARLYVDGDVIFSRCSVALAILVSCKRVRSAAEYTALARSSPDGNIAKQLRLLLAKDLIYISDDLGDEEDDDMEDEAAGTLDY
jgi:50S ribosomal protein L16 3-hydroxylase